MLAGSNNAKAGPKSPQPAQAAGSFADAARAEFAKGNFDKAIDLYRKYLRGIPSDYSAWSQMGAAYYHAGQPQTALKTLQRVERLAADQSYNYYYQGLCLSVLGFEPTAVKYWEYAAYFPDEPGSKAVMELAVSAYNHNDDGRARYWLQVYLHRFPQGGMVTRANELLRSLDPNGKRQEDVKASERPDPESVIFKYNHWSLFNYPHFWRLQIGTESEEIQGYQPDEHHTIVQRTDSHYAFLVNAAIGVGPIREKYATAFAGYAYRQRWNAERETLDAWVKDPSNFQLFPLRGDLLERTHQVFGDVRRQFNDRYFLGLYARLDFTRAGSSFFPSPDDNDLRIVVSMKDTQLMIPWAGISWDDNMRTMIYLYMRKEINKASPDHTNKTYDITGSTGDKAMSFGISHVMEFPAIGLDVNGELFQYEFIFNDFWLDYTRKGVLVGADYNVWQNINLAALVGIYDDQYKLPRIKQGDCNQTGDVNSTTASSDAQQCKRADSGQLLQASVYWSYSSTTRVTGSYQMVVNSSGMKEYSESKNTMRLDVAWAFPSIKRVQRFTERFADAAFTKDTDD